MTLTKNWVKARAAAGDTREAFANLYKRVEFDVDQVMQLEPRARGNHKFRLGAFQDVGSPSFILYAEGERGETRPKPAVTFCLINEATINFHSNWIEPRSHNFVLEWDFENVRWAVKVRGELCDASELSHFALFSVFFQWPVGTD